MSAALRAAQVARREAAVDNGAVPTHHDRETIMTRLLCRSLLTLAAVGCLFSTANGAPPRPNVVLILADDLGFSDLGCYGGEIATPRLDALAANGLRFTQFYNTARCWPTRGALLTGYYAQQIRRDSFPGRGKGGGQGKRPAWAQLLPERLRPLGYRSYHSGKWHVDGGVLAGGFDRSFSLNDHNRFFAPQQLTEDDKRLPAVPAGTDYYATTAVADHAIRCLREHSQQHAGAPFFSFVAFTSPHFPLQAPASDVAKYRDRYGAGWDAIRAARHERQRTLGLLVAPLSPLEAAIGPPYAFPDAIAQLGAGEVNRELAWDTLDETQRAFQAAKMAVHAAMVDRMDQEIGRIVDQLRDMNSLENTLILFLSDNGASAEIMVRGDGHDPQAPAGSAATFLCLGPGWSRAANTPFRRHKTWVHEGGISTPLIAHWPAGIAQRGGFRGRIGHVIDLAPTIVELAGGPWAPGPEAPAVPGKSLAPALGGDSPDAGSDAERRVWWLHEGNRALRAGSWKLVAAKDEPWELYDLSGDRSETKDLAASQPERVAELARQWQELSDQFARDAAE